MNFAEINFEKIDEKLLEQKWFKKIKDSDKKDFYLFINNLIFDYIPEDIDVLYIHSDDSYKFTQQLTGV